MESRDVSWGDAPLLVRALTIASGVVSIIAVLSTVFISSNANRLQQGDNTISVIAAYGNQTVRESRLALYRISRQKVVDPARRVLLFGEVAPVRGALGLVATCYKDSLCLAPSIIDYFCADVLKFDDIFGSGAPKLQRVVPGAADVAFEALAVDCRDAEVDR